MALKPEHTAFIFPGQGSQFVGMGRDLAEIHPIAARVFDQADKLLDIALSRLAWVGPKELLDDGVVMGVRNRRDVVEGIQFHPESILTDTGHDILSNFLSLPKLKSGG